MLRPAEAAPPSAEDGVARPLVPEPIAELGWLRAIPILLAMVRRYRLRLLATFGLGIARVVALIGVGVLSALTVRAVSRGAPVAGPLATPALLAPPPGAPPWLGAWAAPPKGPSPPPPPPM